MTIVKARVRNIGTSLGVIIPSEIIKEENIEEGEDIEISILKRQERLKALSELFGIGKGAKHKFGRDKTDRIERYENNP
ncbi:MAG: AbrB/MazE/SpoVT family DNA-binding domain-containing protein [Nanoarchaeota archaeon]